MTTDFAALIARLTDAGVEFIVVGGVAGTIHGRGWTCPSTSSCAFTSGVTLARALQ